MNQSISDDVISEILRKIDILDIIGDFVHLKKSGRNYLGHCPFHSENTPSFSVSPEKQLYHCFGCGAGGNSFTFLMEMEGYTFVEAVQTLGEKAGVSLQLSSSVFKREDEKNSDKEWMLKAHDLATKLFHHVLLERKESQKAREYLKKRGFTQETIETFQIGFAPQSWDFLTNFLERRNFALPLMEKGGLIAQREDGNYFDRFRGRIMFPIWDSQGNVVAFGGRIIDEGQPKYLNSPETPIFIKGRQLFNFHRARQTIRKKQSTILFEGFVDVISAWQAGIHHATASLGTSLTEHQARMIRRNGERVILCYDGDRAGIEAITRATELLEKQECLIKIGSLPDGLDPDDYLRTYGAEAFQRKVIQEAKTYTAFRLEVLRKGRNLQDDGERMNYIRDCLVLISRLSRAVERDHYLRALSEEFSLSLDALKQEQLSIYRAEKKKQSRDNVEEKWNNNRDNGKHLVAKHLYPAFHSAERKLIAHMLKSKELTLRVQEDIGTQFNIDEHNALAAYLYAFYHESHSPNIGLFLSRLTDTELIQLATELSIIPVEPILSEQAYQDYIHKIMSYPWFLEIEKMEEERKVAEQQGDFLQAAMIAAEILKMKADNR